MNSLLKKADKFVTTGITTVTNSLAAKNTNNENPSAFAPTEDVAPLRTEGYYAKKPPSTEIPVAVPVPIDLPNKPPVVVVHPPTNVNTPNQSTAPIRRPVSHSPEELGFGCKCKCDCCNACFSCCWSCFKSLIPPPWFVTSAFCTVGLVLSSSAFGACDFIHNDDEEYGFSNLCTNELRDYDFDGFSSIAKGAAILSIVLGGICLFLMMAPCLLCCCFRAMNKRQWRHCGCLLAVAGTLQLFTLIAILDCDDCTLGAGGFRALSASFCLSGAAVGSYFVNENESRLRNTVLVQRTVNQCP